MRTFIGTLFASLMVGLVMFSVSASPAEAWNPLKSTHHNGDKAVFDRDRGIFDVCDGEKDGHAVYVYFSALGDYQQYYDDTSGCTRFKSPESYETLGVMYVCEEVWGPDWCSDGVVLNTV